MFQNGSPTHLHCGHRIQCRHWDALARLSETSYVSTFLWLKSRSFDMLALLQKRRERSSKLASTKVAEIVSTPNLG